MRVLLLLLAAIFIFCTKNDQKGKISIQVSKEKNTHVVFPSSIMAPSIQFSKSEFIIEKISQNRVVVKYNRDFRGPKKDVEYSLKDSEGTNYVLQPELIFVEAHTVHLIEIN